MKYLEIDFGARGVDERSHCSAGKVRGSLAHHGIAKVYMVLGRFVGASEVGWVDFAWDMLNREVTVNALLLTGEELASNMLDATTFFRVITVHDGD